MLLFVVVFVSEVRVVSGPMICGMHVCLWCALFALFSFIVARALM